MDQLQDEIKKVVCRHCSSRPYRLDEERKNFLSNFMSRWTGGRDEMKYPQFISGIRSLNVRINGGQAEDLFNAIDVNGNGTISIDEFASKVLSDLKIGETQQNRYIKRVPPKVTHAPVQPQQQAPPAYTSTANFNTSVPNPNKPDMKQVQEVKNAIILDQESSLNLSDLLLSAFKRTVIERGGADSIAAVARMFRIMDDDRNRKVDIEEFQTCMGDYGLRISKYDIQLLIDAINDRPGLNYTTFDKILYALRGTLNQNRAKMVLQAFAVFDRTGDGVVDYEDIKDVYDCSFHPDVKSGKETKEGCLKKWLAIFEGHVKDGKVTKEEFLDYYSNISASIDDDSYFELMIRNSWHIAGGKGQSQNTTNMRVLVIFRDGTQDVVTVENDIGIDPHDHRTIKGLLRKQGYANIQKIRTLS